MQNIRKQIPISEQNINFINDYISTNYNTDFNNKINEILGVFSILIKSSKRELTSIFNFDELELLIILLKDSTYIPNINPNVFLISIIQDALTFNKPENTDNLNVDILIDKVKVLSSIYSYIIINGAAEYYAKVISMNLNSDEDKKQLIKNIFLLK